MENCLGTGQPLTGVILSINPYTDSNHIAPYYSVADKTKGLFVAT